MKPCEENPLAQVNEGFKSDFKKSIFRSAQSTVGLIPYGLVLYSWLVLAKFVFANSTLAYSDVIGQQIYEAK